MKKKIIIEANDYHLESYLYNIGYKNEINLRFKYRKNIKDKSLKMDILFDLPIVSIRQQIFRNYNFTNVEYTKINEVLYSVKNSSYIEELGAHLNGTLQEFYFPLRHYILVDVSKGVLLDVLTDSEPNILVEEEIK